MTWLTLSLCSALFLGLYETAKKSAVRDNAVPPVLFLNVLTAALIWLPLLALSMSIPTLLPSMLVAEPITVTQHFMLLGKSILVGASWIFAFFALKHLPISIGGPIRSTAPIWTVGLAVVAMHERPTAMQWCGVIIILLSFIAFALVGRAENIHFHRDRWVWLMIIATLLGAVSAVYDKVLLQNAELSPATVQAWFSIYLVPVLFPMALRWYIWERVAKPFQWRWTIPTVAITLLIADFLYFTAIASPEALISLISPIRRSSVLVSFVAGIVWMSEKNWRPKLLCILGILAGVFLLSIK